MAFKALLRGALQDRLNQRFLMLTSSSVPVRPPAYIYEQLMALSQSQFTGIHKVSSRLCFYLETPVKVGVGVPMGPGLHKNEDWRVSSCSTSCAPEYAPICSSCTQYAPLNN